MATAQILGKAVLSWFRGGGEKNSVPSELEALFGEETVVLRLTDESPSSKLLGIDIDLGDYTK